MKKIFIILLLLSFFSHLMAYSGSSYQYGHSAKYFSLSGALVADDYYTFQSFSNPASLSHCHGNNYGISYFKMSLDRSIQTFYFSRGLPGNAGISLAILRSGTGEFMGKDSFNNPTHEISMSDYYGLLSFGVNTGVIGNIGLTMKVHYSNLNINDQHEDRYTGNSIVLDIGWSKSISDQFKLGIKAENIINPLLNWNIDRGIGFPSSYTETYPLIIAGGLFYSINTNHRLMLQGDYINYDSHKTYLSRIGYEYLISDKFSLRVGLKGQDNIGIGFGYIFDIHDSIPLLLDYSLDLGSEDEGISHLFTWSLNL